MKNIFVYAALIGLVEGLAAQAPGNDDCAGIVHLGVAPACNPTVYSNVGATPSVVSTVPAENTPACFLGGAAQRDVWFEFTCPETILGFRVTVVGAPNGLINPQVAVYRGDCALDGLAEFYCARAEPGETEVFVDLPDLTKNDRYFIRVSDYSATTTPNSGNFTICVEEIPPTYQIDDIGSTLCKGTLFDTGGPEGNYGADENFTFTICPSSNPGCIRFTLDYYNIEPGKDFGEPFDFLSFYDGKDLNAPLIGAPIGGESSNDGDGGGGVLYQVQAQSGCLTVHFESDNKLQYEGWKGTWVCGGQTCVETPPIAIDTAISGATIAAFLETPFTNVTVAKIDCPKGAYGTFRFPTDKNDLGLEKGLLLTSGRAATVYNPGSAFANHEWTKGGDDDLDYLSLAVDGKALLSVDACVVEVDAFVASDELSFEYVFGSEEYPEYVNEDYNDIFAFLVSGPGIVGDPNIKNQKNIAVLPGTNTAIQIDNVNNLLNWPYYRDNRLGKNVVYDGLTADSLGRKKQLTARIKVIPCNTYHLKFAIADRYDGGTNTIDRMYDSGVFIANIRGGGPELTLSYGSGIDYYIEDCSGNLDQLVLRLPEAKAVPVSYTVTIGGTATRDVDYLLTMPNVVTFQPGQTQLAFPIQPLSDNLTEGTETITIAISASLECGNVVFSTVTAELKDNVAVHIEGGDTLRVCAGGTLQLQVSGALQYFWQPPGLVSNPYVANPSIVPTQDRWYKVRGKISNCEQVDSVFVDVLNPELSVEALGKTTLCLGESVRLLALNNVGNVGLKWSPSTGLSDPLAPDPVAKPTKTTLYTATLTLPGCELTKDIKITVDTLYFPTLTAVDTAVCRGASIRLAQHLNTQNLYQWLPVQELDNPKSSGPVATPTQTTTYVLTVNTPNGGCSKTDSIRVRVLSANVAIAGGESRNLCLGDTVLLHASVTPGNATDVVWSSTLGNVFPPGPRLGLQPMTSVTVVATYRLSTCLVRDSVLLRVDSLPYSLDIVADTVKPVYCPGEALVLSSPQIVDPAAFSGVKNEWLPFPGQTPPLDAWTLVVTATETHRFQRVSTIGACRDTADILIDVGQKPVLRLTADTDTLCPGQQAHLLALVDPPGEALVWQAAPGLSCTQCPDPTVSPTTTTTYRVYTPEADCPSDTAITISVGVPPLVLLPADLTLCPELDTLLLLNGAPAQPGVQYEWTAVPPGYASKDAQPRVKTTQTTIYLLSAKGQCLYRDTVTVTLAPKPVLDAGPDQTICFGQSAQLSAAASEIGAILWEGGQSNAVITVSPTQNTRYVAALRTHLGCRTTDTVAVIVRPPLVLNMVDETGKDTLCAGDPVVLRLETLSPAGTPLFWQRGDVLLPFPSDSLLREIPSLVDGEAATFTYTFRTANPYACPDVEQQFVYVVTRCFALPNAFTPNGDATNDSFGPALFGTATQILQFDIYSRWGEKVFSVEDANGQTRWNGTLAGGREAPSDVYVYLLKVRYPDGREEAFRGEVTLLR